MPSIYNRWSWYSPLTNTPDAFVDPVTGSISLNAGEGAGTTQSDASLGGWFRIPGDVVALGAYATFNVDYDCTCWSNLFGASYSWVSASISLFNGRDGESRILLTSPWTIVDGESAWVGVHGTQGFSSRTISLRCYADWGQPYGAESTWQVAVNLDAQVQVYGWAGARARARAVVSRIDYEMFWPA